MFFILSKLLAFLIKPFIWILILIGVMPLTKSHKTKKKLKFSAIILALIFSNQVVFGEFCRLWEVDGQKIDQVGQYDLGIVLTGMAAYNNDLERISVGKAADRVWQTLNLYHAGKIGKILISGGSGHIIDRGLNESQQIQGDLIRWGVPEEDILIEAKSRNTYENALFTKEFLERNQITKARALLITSATHMKRANACFEQQGMKLDLFSTDHMTAIKRKYFVEQFVVPSVSTLRNWETLIKEWVGYLVYDMVGYI